MKLDQIVLEGKYVRLEPLAASHKEGLCAAISDGRLWDLFTTIVPHPKDIDQFLKNASIAYEKGESLAFATIDGVQGGQIVGSTRFMNVNSQHKRIEIGFTFLGKTWQRTRINTEAKLLMLTHAFEELDMNRVELLTDYLNSKSRQAILRLGAREEGILRKHMVMRDGRVRDSVIFSIIKDDWPGVKQNLVYKLHQYV
jgi:RimJ/RimL family protein N-acetyltransferase